LSCHPRHDLRGAELEACLESMRIVSLISTPRLFLFTVSTADSFSVLCKSIERCMLTWDSECNGIRQTVVLKSVSG